jgi:hypothetical protein
VHPGGEKYSRQVQKKAHESFVPTCGVPYGRAETIRTSSVLEGRGPAPLRDSPDLELRSVYYPVSKVTSFLWLLCLEWTQGTEWMLTDCSYLP